MKDNSNTTVTSSADDQKARKLKRKRSKYEEDIPVNQRCGMTRGTDKGDTGTCSSSLPIPMNQPTTNAVTNSHGNSTEVLSHLPKFPNYQYILAPMVGASELPFRFLCRKYGAQLCYTPMMSSQSFATSSDYRKEYFGTANSERVHDADHPIYAHVYANTVSSFVAAAQQALAMNCDGIDLNLGCPQRTAYIGHYGSYLCTNDIQTHQHISNMLTAAAEAVQHKIPITAKVRLLHPTDANLTLDLCRTLYNSGKGASLIAIHARPRASWERTGPSARDGPAKLNQVTSIVQTIRMDQNAKSKGWNQEQQHLRIVTNGNTITYDDVVNNLQSTMADGIMSAEGLLDNPALYLPRLLSATHCDSDSTSSNSKNDMDKTYITVWSLKEDFRYKYHNYKPIGECGVADGVADVGGNINNDHGNSSKSRKIHAIETKMRKVDEKLQSLREKKSLSQQKVQMKYEKYRSKKEKLQKKIQKLQIESDDIAHDVVTATEKNSNDSLYHSVADDSINLDPHIERRTVTLQSLHDIASDMVLLGMEYLDWATIYPTTIRTIVFHIRRMCKAELVQYQLLQPCLQATTIDTVRDILNRIIHYRIHPDTFVYDKQRAQEEKDAITRKKYEEGKRKAFEERMIRKAKREKKDDLFYYLSIGAELPTKQQMEHYRTLDRETLVPIWKQNHSQHCISYHMDSDKCQRGRACAFLHVDTTSKMSLEETDECAG
jgi:tRNA-dihydrouridine synthase 1